MIADMLAVYGDEVAPFKKSARQIGYCIGSLLRWWGTKTVADITAKSCRAYVASKSALGAAADLKVLKAAVDYWNREYGPLTVVPTYWRPKDNPPKERWLTRDEAARLLRAAKPYLHQRRAILLQLYTGSRPGVILALRWDQVDLSAGILYRLPRGVNGSEKKRSPPVKLGRRIAAHLRRWKRLDGPIPYVCHFEGRATRDPHGTWDRIVRNAGLDDITRHTLRHTRATWMMKAGVPIWDAAGFLSMTVKTLEGVYGHHSPDHQERAANI
jgi:integrase